MGNTERGKATPQLKKLVNGTINERMTIQLSPFVFFRDADLRDFAMKCHDEMLKVNTNIINVTLSNVTTKIIAFLNDSHSRIILPTL